MNDVLKTGKQLFYNICVTYDLNYDDLLAIAKAAGVHKGVVGDMFVTVAVKRSEAEKVLVAFSQYTDPTWTLDNVRVALQPTFAELHATHQFDLAKLAIGAGVEASTITMMLAGTPVTAQDARLVLQMASRLASEHYTLETVDVPVINEEVQ